MSCHFFLIVLWDVRSCALNKHRKAGSAFSRLQVGLQAVQEVLPIPSCLFKDLINLGEPIMREDHLCPILDRRELPGDAGPGPLWRAFPGNPVNFRSFVQFGHLKLKDLLSFLA